LREFLLSKEGASSQRRKSCNEKRRYYDVKLREGGPSTTHAERKKIHKKIGNQIVLLGNKP